jgi:UDP-3-O-acyl N-acetylglucosamine deacetylase
MTIRSENTIARPVQIHGYGFFSGRDVSLTLLPACAGHGLKFRRVDLPGTDPIPATIERVVLRPRRTAIESGAASVELTEHLLAAFAGLQVDNCLVEINGEEVPGLDGSSLGFVEALTHAGLLPQQRFRRLLVVERPVRVASPDGSQWIVAEPTPDGVLSIGATVDYGTGSPIPKQYFSSTIRSRSFVRDIASARTFVLESEVAMLRKAGYGLRATAADLLVFGPGGPIDNQLRAPNECARHKVLDCLGDLALLGCDLVARIEGHRSGHHLNAELARSILREHVDQSRSRAA